MKKIIACLIFAATLLTLCVPFGVSAAVPSDYSEYLVNYWSFDEEETINKATCYVDSATKGNDVNYMKVKGSVEDTGNSKVTIPAESGNYLAVDPFNNAADLMPTKALTFGFKLALNAVEGSSVTTTVIFNRPNSYMIRAVHDASANKYTVEWINDSLPNRSTCIVDVFDGHLFEYGTEYYLFFVVEADTLVYNDAERPVNHVTGYYSTDGKDFVSNRKEDTKHWFDGVSHNTMVELNNVFSSSGNTRSPSMGTTAATGDHATICVDDIWYFNTAVDASSLPIIALHGENIYEAPEATEGAPIYRGCQFSAVADSKYDVRFVATIDSLDYKEVGFEITLLDQSGTPTETQVYTTHSVFKEIIGTDTIGKKVTYTAKELEGEYIYALAITGIPTDASYTFVITPYHVEMGDTKRVHGVSYEVSVKDGKLLKDQAPYTPEATS